MDNSSHIGKRPGRGIGILSVFILLFSFQALPGCSPKIIEHVVYQHDTTQVVHIDSVRYWQKDSVFVREKGDTVYQYVEKIRYRDRFRVDTLITIHELRDTTTIEKKVERELTAGQKMKINSFWWLLIGLIASLGWIFRKQIVKLIKL